MPRIPTHTVANAPENSREIAAKLEKKIGKLRNIHAGMAHAPAVIGATTASPRPSTPTEPSTPAPERPLHWPWATKTGVTTGQAAHTLSGRRAGLSTEQSTAIRAGTVDFDQKLSALTGLVREAAAHTGAVTNETWQAALAPPSPVRPPF